MVCFERSARRRSKMFLMLPVTPPSTCLADLFSLHSMSMNATAFWMCASSPSSNTSVRNPFGEMIVSSWILMVLPSASGTLLRLTSLLITVVLVVNVEKHSQKTRFKSLPIVWGGDVLNEAIE